MDLSKSPENDNTARIPEGSKDVATPAGKPAGEIAIQPRRGGGPKTPAGKAASSQNARKHSFFAATLFRPDEVGGEEHHAFTALLTSLTEQYQPLGVLEELLVEKIATESVRFRRLLAYENTEFDREHAWLKQGVDKLGRYQAAVNRQLFQCIAQLERLQRLRSGDFVPPPLSMDVRVEASATDIAQLDADAVADNSSTLIGGTHQDVAAVCVQDHEGEVEEAEGSEGGEDDDECQRIAGEPEVFCETNSSSSPDIQEARPAVSPAPSAAGRVFTKRTHAGGHGGRRSESVADTEGLVI
jgi:hypothetical protein